MKKFTLFVLLIIFAFTLFGCAGNGGGASGGGADTLNNRGSGALSVKINWPQASKSSVLSSTYSIKLNVCTQTTSSAGATTQYAREVNAVVITHASANTSENKTINGIPIGPRVVIAQAYNSSGAEIGYGTTSVTVVSGTNDGVVISLSSGTFSYTITGMADVSAPTSSSGGGTVTYHYLFVNNYYGGLISVINQETNAVVGTITMPSTMAKLTKGAFNYNGTAYYVVDSTPGASRIYKVPITDTNNWSSNRGTVIYNFYQNETAREILYERTSAGAEYLWVGIKYISGAMDQAYIKRINLSNTNDMASGADSLDEAYNFEIVGFCDPTIPNSDGKAIVLYNKSGQLYANACHYNGTEFLQPTNLQTSTVAIGGISDGFGHGNTFKTVGGLMLVDTIYIPKTDGFSTVTFNNSTNKLGSRTDYNSFANGFKLILSGGTYYGINNNALKCAVDLATAPQGWTSTLDSGMSLLTKSFSDMAASSDGSSIYVTNFGKGIYSSANYGREIYVKTLSNLSSTSPDYTIMVGYNPFSIVLKP